MVVVENLGTAVAVAGIAVAAAVAVVDDGYPVPVAAESVARLELREVLLEAASLLV